MNIPDNIVPANISNFITERKQIRDKWRASQAEAGQLNAQSIHIPQQVSLEPVSPLTQSQTPPDELRAVPPLLDNALTRVNQIKAQIAEQQEAIQKIKRTELILLASLIILGIIILAFLAHAINLF